MSDHRAQTRWRRGRSSEQLVGQFCQTTHQKRKGLPNKENKPEEGTQRSVNSTWMVEYGRDCDMHAECNIITCGIVQVCSEME